MLRVSGLGCDDSIHCRGNGQCAQNSYDAASWSCDCYWNRHGDYCDWNERDIQIMSNVTYTVLYNIQDQISQQTAFSIAKVINNIVKIENGLNKKSFRLIKTILNNILSQDLAATDPQKLILYRIELYDSIFDSLSRLIF